MVLIGLEKCQFKVTLSYKGDGVVIKKIIVYLIMTNVKVRKILMRTLINYDSDKLKPSEY